MQRRRIVGLGIAAVLVLLAIVFALRGRRSSPAPTRASEAPAAGSKAGSNVAAIGAPTRPATSPAPAPARAKVEDAAVIARATWGSGPNQLGRSRPDTGNPEAPMSLAPTANGGVVVLDQVNGRLVRFGRDGRVEGTSSLSVQGAQDVAVASDGTAAVLDRMADRAVALVAPDGHEVGELPVEGKGIEEGGGATGVFVDGRDVYVEDEHAGLVRVGDTSGRVDEARPSIPGRPSRDGRSFLTAALDDADTGAVSVTAVDRPSLDHRFTREVRFGVPVAGILLLDSDRQGTIYLAVQTLSPSPGDPGTPLPSDVLLTCLAPADGQPLGLVELPGNDAADESFRELAALDSGGVVYLQRDDAGASLERYTCP